MLNNAQVMPTLPVADLDRARRFYEGVLGLKPAGPPTPDGIMYECGRGTRLFLFPRAPTKADHTVASFVVENIDGNLAAGRLYRQDSLRSSRTPATWAFVLM